ncbi:MAG: GYDIA family GHMP kinase [Bacteroidota bacterium]
MEKKAYYSNGKLLITGEYLVLSGALALAVPTVKGQELLLEEGTGYNTLHWKSYFKEDCWFEAKFSLPGIEILEAGNPKTAAYLQTILREANRINKDIFAQGSSVNMITKLGFHPEWGLGSSSSLINNIASLFEISPFELFFNTQKGSGYDIACAEAKTPLFYRLENGEPKIEKADFNPPFKEKLAFIYSGSKQDSERSLSRFLDMKGSIEYQMGGISMISREILGTQSHHEFNDLLNEHEEIMAKVLQLPKVKGSRFPDFPGSIKSLGAWGGDFLLASSEIGFEEIKSYFSGKSLNTIFSFDELVLH